MDSTDCADESVESAANSLSRNWHTFAAGQQKVEHRRRTFSSRTYNVNNYLYSGEWMRSVLKRKNYYLDEKKIRRARKILGARTETETIDAALSLVVFRREILKSLEKVAGKGGVEKIF